MGRRGISMVAVAAGALTLVGAARPAAANCAAGDDYGAVVEGSSVRVCPRPNSGVNEDRHCPDPLGTGMLRESLETGEVVLLAELCSTEPSYPGGPAAACYLDECVPAGTYRYGFATPWEDPFCGGCPPSQYFTEVTVEATSVEACVRSSDDSAPEPYPGSLPWSDDSDICDDSGFGCSFVAGPRELVFGVQGLVALLGLGVMLRRRRSRR